MSAALVTVLVASACTGVIGGDEGAEATEGPETSSTSESFSTSPGLRRLTRIEYRNTVRSLFDVEIDIDQLSSELIVDGHSQIAAAQKVGYDDVDSYYLAGDGIAAQVAPNVLSATGCQDAACLEDWASDLLRRAFRRELDPDDAQFFIDLLDDEEGGVTLEQRVQTFIGAILSSPRFLYRWEVGAPIDGEPRRRRLDGYEIASRLSYLVWQTTPDDALLAAAAEGELDTPEGRLAQLERMLLADETLDGVEAFVLDWMGVFRDALAEKDPSVLDGLPADLTSRARASLRESVRRVAAEERGMTDLLAAETAYADEALAPLFGAEVEGEELSEVSVDLTKRRGILTHPLIIASHSKESGASPFPMGKFVFEHVLCRTIPPPPPDIPPPDVPEGLTLREELEQRTSEGACFACHSLIGPAGFAFLPFDPAGRHSETDPAGRPWDTAGDLLLPSPEGGQEAVPFASISDMASVLADHPAVEQCLARRIFRWTYGRFEASADDAAIESVLSSSEGLIIQDAYRALVGSESFAHVMTEDSP